MTARQQAPRPPPPDAASTSALGRTAEALVARELESAGWTILGRNLRTRRGEIDIVARRAGVVHVVEVRSRVGTRAGHPAETIGHRKRTRIAATVATLSREGRLPAGREIRFDVASVTWETPTSRPRVEIVENAFDAVDLM